MRRTTTCAVFISAIALAWGATTVSARNFSVTSQQLRATWSAMTFESGIDTVTCPVTLEGSLHARTIAKVASTLLGYIHRAALNAAACTGGGDGRGEGSTLLTETLPWHWSYQSFSGTLPNITSLTRHIINYSFARRVLGVLCRYRTSVAEPLVATLNIGAGGVLMSVTIIGTIRSSTAGCPSHRFGGAGGITVAGAAIRVTITLI
jgi:hypothetical protein